MARFLARRLYNRYNHAHVAGQHMQPTQGPGPDSKCSKFRESKTVEVGFSCKELKPCQRKIATDEIKGKKNYRDRSNIERASVSALTGSGPPKMAVGRQRVSALCISNPSRPTLCDSATHLNHSAIGSCQSAEKKGILFVILLNLKVFRNLQLLFWVQNCRSLIAQVVYQGQARNTRILEGKPFIDTSYRI